MNSGPGKRHTRTNLQVVLGRVAPFLLPAASIPGVLLATGAPPAGGATPGPVYVDCAAPAGGDGSLTHPLDTLAAAGAVALQPGQQLLFQRGTLCRGDLELHSSGSPAGPVVIGAYGTGPLPRIAGRAPDAVQLDSVSNVTMEDLDITNRGTSDTPRRGVHVVADGVTVSGVTLRDLVIRRVDGNLGKDTGGSGGIQLDALGTAPYGRFDGVRIFHNHIDHVSRSGIFVVGTQSGDRPADTRSWPQGSTHVVVKDNTVDHLAGDGIVATGTVGAVLEDNEVSDGNQAGTSFTSPGSICDAGIWAFDANDTVIRHNLVSHMEFNGCDGTGYDVDYDQDGTVVEDNVSVDNAGGFILLCTDEHPHHAEVRYNLSVGDASMFNDAPCAIGSGNIGTLSGIRMYNNTVVGPDPDVTLELHPQSSVFAPGTFLFANNIVDATTPQSTAVPCGTRCIRNLHAGLPPSGSHPITGRPGFRDPSTGPLTGTGLRLARGYRVAADSPAVAAGKQLSGSASTDFFGHSLPAGERPTVGFDQVDGPAGG